MSHCSLDFIQPVNKCLLNAYFVPGTALGLDVQSLDNLKDRHVIMFHGHLRDTHCCVYQGVFLVY